MRRVLSLITVLALQCGPSHAAEFPLFESLRSDDPPRFVGYTPSELDPRNPANQIALKTSSIRADLEALRPAFDGLVLYGYNEGNTVRIVATARDLGFRSVLVGIWNPRSAAECDGAADVVRQFAGDMVLGVLVGNEGLTFGRYEQEDLTIAAERLRWRLPKSIPLATSEPLVGYERKFVRDFGDFHAPNVHPVFDRSELPAAKAAVWARERALELAEKTNRPVVLKETGFPHAGKPAYTPLSQAAFWRAYTGPGLLARVDGAPGAWVYHGVGFEAFDLPWKSEASGLEIEKSWGLLAADRKPLPAFEVWRELAPKRTPPE